MRKEDLKNWTREQMELKIISLSSSVDSLKKDNAAYSQANDLYKENIQDCEKKNDYLCNLRNELEAENKALKHRIKDLEDICDGSCFSDYEDLPFGDYERDKLIAELQDQHRQDCIKINQLNVTIDTLVDKYSRLRKTAGVD